MIQSLHLSAPLRNSSRYLFFLILCFPVLIGKANDTIPPAIVCPPNYSAVFHIGSCDTIFSYNVTAFDNSPGMTLLQTAGIASGGVFPIGTTTNVFVATDSSGNSSSCSFKVSLNISSMFSCSDLVTVYMNENCTGTIDLRATLDPPYHLQCFDSLEFKFGPLFGPFQPNRPLIQSDLNQNYIVVVRDRITGNTCWGNLAIQDTLPPNAICQDIVLPFNVPPAILTPRYLVDSLAIQAGEAIVLDNCGGLDTIFYIDLIDVFDCAHPLSYTRALNRTWTFTDVYGNSRTCLQHIYFERDSNEVRFPADTIFSCNYTGNTSVQQLGVPFTAVNGHEFSLFPQLPSGYFITHEDVLSPYQCAGSRVLNRIWSVTDVCNDTPPYDPDLVHIQHIYFVDDSKPIISAPQKLVFKANSGICTDTIVFSPLLIQDLCSPIDSVIGSWINPSDTTMTTISGVLNVAANGSGILLDTAGVFNPVAQFPTGVTTVTWTAWDVCGNSNTATTLVEVYDGIAPTATCATNFTAYLDMAGQVTISTAALATQWADNCADTVAIRARQISTNDLFSDHLNFDCADAGFTVAYEVRVYDVLSGTMVPDTFAAGQFAACITEITVLDTTALQCMAPENISVSCSDFNPDLIVYGDFTFSCSTDSVQYFTQMGSFDTICNSGQITRIAVGYRGNQSIICEQEITVNTAPNSYFVRFPRDTTVNTCSATYNFGEPVIFGINCQMPQVTFVDDTFAIVPDACFKIERNWKIQNHCTSNQPLVQVGNPLGAIGPVVSEMGTVGTWAPTVAPFVPSGVPVNYSTYWTPSGGGYLYKQIIKFNGTTLPTVVCPTAVINVCDTSENNALFWNQPFWTDPLGGNDKREAEVDLRCYFTDNCIVAGNYIPAYFQLYLDLNNDNSTETVVPATGNLPGYLTFGNDDNTVPDMSAQYDHRPVAVGDKYIFGIEVVAEDSVQFARMVWSSQNNPNEKVLPQLPYGKHRVRWIIQNYCGFERICTMDFEVKECCQAPTVACVTDTLPYILDNGIGVVTADELLTFFDDNGCSAALGLSVGAIPPSQPQSSILVNCEDTGYLSLLVYATNQDNVSGVCTAVVAIIDTSGLNCDPAQVAFGEIKTYTTNEGVLGVNAIFTSSSGVGGSDLTSYNGQFVWQSPDLYTGGYQVLPHKNDDPANGLTAFDLVKISRHILNLESLEFPYQMIAADANRSGTITTFDIVELRKLLLGTYDSLPNCPSWRFIPSGYIFNNATNNPFQPVFPESLTVSPGLTYNFVGIKVGDLDYSVIPNFQETETEDRRPISLYIAEQWVEAGVPVTITCTPEKAGAAIQGTLALKDAILLDIVPGEGQSIEDFAMHGTDRMSFVAWERPIPFSLIVKPLQSSWLSQLISINNRITAPLAFDAAGKEQPLEIVFEHGRHQLDWSVEAVPNPTNGITNLSFKQREAGYIFIEVRDARGQVVFSKKEWYPVGRQAIKMDASQWPSGVYHASIATPVGHSSIRVVVE